MEDRELLELAAKAAGIVGDYGALMNAILINEQDHSDGRKSYTPWNPLINDGDALRLAVKLDLNIDVTDGYSGVQALNVAFYSEPHGADRFSATRRAIVRAAAEIGKQA